MNRHRGNRTVRGTANRALGAMIAGLGLLASDPRPATADETRNETTTKRETTSGTSNQRSVRKSGGGSASASSSSSASGKSFGFGAAGSGGRAGGRSGGDGSNGGGVSGSSARAAAQASLGEDAPARTGGASADKTDSSRATTKRVGKRTITTVDQDARTIVIIESPTRLTVQVLEHEPEDAPPKTFAAPNAEVLQAKHPEAFRLYQEHVLNRRGTPGPDVASLLRDAAKGAAAPGAGVLGDLPAGIPEPGDLPRIDGEVDVKQLLERQLREVREKIDSPELRQLIDEQLRELRP